MAISSAGENSREALEKKANKLRAHLGHRSRIYEDPREIDNRGAMLRRLADMKYPWEQMGEHGEEEREIEARKRTALWAVVYDWYFRMISAVSLAWNRLASPRAKAEQRWHPSRKQLDTMKMQATKAYEEERRRRFV